MIRKSLFISITALFLSLCCFSTLAANVPISLFPLSNYSQDIDAWLSPKDPEYKKPLLPSEYQKQRMEQFYKHTFSTDKNAYSPWSKKFVTALLNKDPGVLVMQQNVLLAFSNKDKSSKNTGYGENFHPYTQKWIDTIANNINISLFNLPIKYQEGNRGIIVKNTYARGLPTHDPHFYHFELPGQGYPFDNLQDSALWVGTPVYIIAQSKDGAWSLVITPSFISWIDTDAVAKTNKKFISHWEKLVKSQLVAITTTQTSIVDAMNKSFQFTAYVGSVFPLLSKKSQYLKIGIPVKNSDGKAYLHRALVNKNDAVKMPLPATPENFSKLIKTLQNRPYGWGNSYFYNDCSAELQSLYTPFGIWLPRNSSKQSFSGKTTDVTSESPEKRLAYLMQNGHKLMSIVYIGGHMFMYMGNYPNPNDKEHTLMAMTYQNLWGLYPTDKSRRAVIGQSVLLPLLLSYPEDLNLNTLANGKFFQVINLDQWPELKDERENSLKFYF